MPAFLDSRHLFSFLLSVARLAAWLVLLSVVFLLLERLAAENINVEYAYASTMTAPRKALGIFHTSNPKRASQILREAGAALAGGARSAGRRPLHTR